MSQNTSEQCWERLFERMLSRTHGTKDVRSTDEADAKGLEGARIPLAFAQALIRGDEYLARLIWSAHGYFTLEVKPSEDGRLWYTSDLGDGSLPIDNALVALNHHEVDSFLHLLCSSGATDLFKAFRKLDGILQHRLSTGGNTRHELFDILPKLVDGRMERPELALTLHDRGLAYRPSWFSKTLCWATPSMVATHPGQLIPYKAEQYAELRSPHGGGKVVRLNELVGELLARTDLRVPGKAEKVAPEYPYEYWLQRVFFELDGCTPQPSVTDACLIEQFGDEGFVTGIGREFAEGLVLCRASVNFLVTKMDYRHPGTDIGVTEVLKNYFPLLNGMVFGDEADSIPTPSMNMFRLEIQSGLLISTLSTHNGVGQVGPTLLASWLPTADPELVRRLIESWNGKLTLRDACEFGLGGVAGSELKASVSKNSIIKWLEKGVRLPDGCGVTVEGMLDANQTKHLVQMAENHLVVNDVTTDMDVETQWSYMVAPTATTACLLAREYALRRGHQDFQPLATTNEHMSILFELFGAEALVDRIAALDDRLQTLAMAGTLDI